MISTCVSYNSKTVKRSSHTDINITCNTKANTYILVLKDPVWRRIYWQKWKNIHKHVFIHVQSPENKNCCAFVTSLRAYLQSESVLLYEVHHVVQPCFYSSPQWTIQTLTLGTAFHVFSVGKGETRTVQVVEIERSMGFTVKYLWSTWA